MFGLFAGFDERKLKANMKMSLQRIKMEIQKQTNITKVQKKDIGKLIGAGKKELAKIKCEHIIRTDDMIEAYGILELFLELLHERVHYISQAPKNSTPATDLSESIASVIFCAKRLDIAELTEVANQFRLKYSTLFTQAAENNTGGIVNQRLHDKVTLLPIKAMLLNGYMVEIAEHYGVEYEPEEIEDENEAAAAPNGSSIPIAPASNLTQAYNLPSPYTLAPTGGGGGSGSENGGGINTGTSTALPTASAVMRPPSDSKFEKTYDGDRNIDGQKHGRGTLEFPEGIYTGQFFRDKRHGNGMMRYHTNGAHSVHYDGQWWDGCRHGTGAITAVVEGVDRVLYSGEWVDGYIRDQRSRVKLQDDLHALGGLSVRSDSGNVEGGVNAGAGASLFEFGTAGTRGTGESPPPYDENDHNGGDDDDNGGGGGISGTHTSVETVEAVMYVDGFTEDMDSLTVLEQSPGPGATSESAINDANAKVNPSNSTLPLPATHIHINMPVTVGGVSANNSAQASTNTIDVLQARLAALRK